jgi:hypothetical protein
MKNGHGIAKKIKRPPNTIESYNLRSIRSKLKKLVVKSGKMLSHLLNKKNTLNRLKQASKRNLCKLQFLKTKNKN